MQKYFDCDLSDSYAVKGNSEDLLGPYQKIITF